MITHHSSYQHAYNARKNDKIFAAVAITLKVHKNPVYGDIHQVSFRSILIYPRAINTD